MNMYLTQSLLLQTLMPFITLASFIVPKRKRLYVYGSTKQLKYSGNPKALFEYASINKPEIVSIFFTADRQIEKNIKAKNHSVEINFFKKIWLLLRAEILFIESTVSDISPFYILLGNFKIVNLWHGTPLKKIEADSKHLNKLYKFITSFNNKRYFLIPACDSETAALLKSAFQNTNVLVTGYPRNDILFNGKRGDIPTFNYLLGYDKVFLYAPTFRDNSGLVPFTESGLAKIEEYCKSNNYLFLVKEHPNKQQIDVERYINIKNISKEDIDVQELMLYTDVLISDYSSLVFEFSLLMKPIIFYPFDIETYLSSDREMYYEYTDVFPGPFCKDELALVDLLENPDVWFKESIYSVAFTEFRNRFNFFLDGNSSARLMSVLE